MKRIAVVTPYYKESDDILMKCHESVLGQTISCQHILVADGHPRRLFDKSPNTMHVILPKANADNGNTPRALGGLLADSYGFDGVAYLDADNWYEPTHIQNLVNDHERTRFPLVSCKRRFFDLEGNWLAIEDIQENANLHVDTSCWLLLRPAFSLLRAWLMPKILGPVCDRVFLTKVIHDRFQVSPTNYRTVAFRTQYAGHYRAAGATIPAGAKNDDCFHAARAYLASPEGIIETTKMLGFYPSIG